MAAVSEAVTVTAATPSLLTARGGGSTMRTADLEKLPTGRTPSLVAELAPGLTNNTPNVNQVTISGAVAYDNVFLLDGVDIGDNLFARPDDLFVEEAIEETQVLTSAVSAEYGRFSGGVVNAVTKRGGDLFSGSVRSNLSNAAWTNETPFEEAAGQTAPGQDGPLLRGHVRRPAAARIARGSSFRDARSRATPASRSRRRRRPFQQTDDQQRWDLKVTATPMTNQTVQVQYLDRRQSKFAPSMPITIDPTAGDHTETPGDLSSTTSSARRARCGGETAAPRRRHRPRRPPGRRHERGGRGATPTPSPSRSTASATTRSSAFPETSTSTCPTGRVTGPTSRRSRSSCPRPSSERGPSSASTSPEPTPIAVTGSAASPSARTGWRSATGSFATALRAAGVPVCLTLAGGYADPIEDTVGIHLNTLRTFADNGLGS